MALREPQLNMSNGKPRIAETLNTLQTPINGTLLNIASSEALTWQLHMGAPSPKNTENDRWPSENSPITKLCAIAVQPQCLSHLCTITQGFTVP